MRIRLFENVTIRQNAANIYPVRKLKFKLRCTLDALHLLDAAGRQLWSYAREATLKIKR